MKLRYDMHFYTDLTEEQEKILQGFIYSLYSKLERSLRWLAKGKNLPNAIITRKLFGNDGGVSLISTMAEGQLERLPNIFKCERINDTRDRYYLLIDVGSLSNLKIHSMAKDYGNDLGKEFSFNFKKVVTKQMKYYGNYDLIETKED